MMTFDRSKITYRPLRPEDRNFLFQLYASTRENEMKIVPWTDQEKEQFVRLQFEAQTQHYAAYYDETQFFVIEDAWHLSRRQRRQFAIR